MSHRLSRSGAIPAPALGRRRRPPAHPPTAAATLTWGPHSADARFGASPSSQTLVAADGKKIKCQKYFTLISTILPGEATLHWRRGSYSLQTTVPRAAPEGWFGNCVARTRRPGLSAALAAQRLALTRTLSLRHPGRGSSTNLDPIRSTDPIRDQDTSLIVEPRGPIYISRHAATRIHSK
ncbi:hypothetical protein E2C01_026044 [Portunus trituberculatus]|uniref:Uncharacterized protein n=1 Tax=Portunus trituberculatus TaxID=210409 RepID=A0A5B7EHS7_PORTR|nr:hypothetical protein [Portunus trituberculatus]